MNLRFSVTGDEAVQKALLDFPKDARKAAKLAINDTVRRGRRKTKQKIMSQVNLKSSYLNKSRLTEFFATDDNLVGSIVGRRRPTSLARFDAQQLYRSGKKKAGVAVRVKNARKKIPNAFLVNLKAGNRDGANQGLAIRLPEGKKPRRRFSGKPLYKGSNVWLLYGPSVNQVMTADVQGQSIIERLKPELNTYLNREFRRQFGRLRGGK